MSTPISENQEQQHLPPFDTTFKSPSPFFYFTHLIDGPATTLTIQVLGPNLTYTFTHSRAQQLLSASRITTALQRKTVGFLAVLEANGKRVVLAWAESGHGAGKFGDLLDRQDSVLPNRLWTRRVVAVGDLLGIKMGRMFDRGRYGVVTAETRGIFQGSHVEVKLAVHAVYMLLRMFNITDDLDSVTASHLRKLRDVRWENGAKPAFEIYFSRKNCHPCGNLISKLADLTGIPLKLLWKDRLVPVIYHKPNPNPNRRKRQPSVEIINPDDMEVDDQDVDFGEEEDQDEVLSISDDSTVDVRDAAEVIDLTDEQTSGRGAQLVDRYIDGLAYCVGQIDLSAEGAQRAIVEFARAMVRLYGRRVVEVEGEVGVEAVEERTPTSRSRRTRPHQIRIPGIGIRKPLPATPENEPPASRRTSATAQAIFGAEQRTLFGTEQHSNSQPYPVQNQQEPANQNKNAKKTTSHHRERSSSPKKGTTNVPFRERSPRKSDARGVALGEIGVPLSRWNFT